MSVNFVKIVEVLSIESKNDASYLHIKIYLDQELELFWEIDASTANSLRSICEFDETHKYRLSLRTKTYSDPGNYISYVTKTYLSNSNRLTFSCSEEFVHQVELLKQCTSNKDLLELPFFDKSLPEDDIEDKEIEDTIQSPIEEQVEANSVVTINNKQMANINEFSSEIVPLKSQEAIIEKEVVQDVKAIESLLKTAPHKVKLKSNKWVYIASLSLLAIVILVSLVIFKPDQKVTQHQENEEVKPVLQDTKLDAPSSDKPNSLTIDEPITFNLPEGYIAFTFNEGPSAYTEQIVDVLNQFDIGATFFFIGKEVEKYPNSVQSVYSNGYTIGSMTMNNAPIATLPYEEQEKELLASMESLQRVTKEKVHLFRPPAALFNQDTQDILANTAVKLTLWNNNPQEKQTGDSAQLLETIKESELSGSIVYLQESQEVVDSLAAMIEMAQKQNLKIVSIN
ncbi:polysaccharide deacetylase family protein [Ureibacillus chungkukjangi]|uniref:polysaccharide deacetylase family protein n=1 Tax=Ureibacillus chungkukjangi TaxID=1202712 RepID=UPI00384E3B82